MKLIVFSDSHRELNHMRDVIAREKPDQVIHLGDHDADAKIISREFQTLPVAMIRGNCDRWSDTPETLVISLGGLRFFLCHGHTYGVKSTVSTAVYAAMEANADVLLYGHTHCADRQEIRGIKVLNPGSCGCGSEPSYGFFLIENGKITDWGLACC